MKNTPNTVCFSASAKHAFELAKENYFIETGKTVVEYVEAKFVNLDALAKAARTTESVLDEVIATDFVGISDEIKELAWEMLGGEFEEVNPWVSKAAIHKHLNDDGLDQAK